MAVVIRMPEVLAGAAEAVLSRWLIEEGQEVEVGDTLAEIETEKANVDYQSEEQGKLARILVQAGQTVEVGTPIAVFASAGETEKDLDDALASAGEKPGLASAAVAAEGGSETAADSVGIIGVEPGPQTPRVSVPFDGRRYMSPLVRKRAREEGIDLARVIGTGPGGRIVKKDLDLPRSSGVATTADSVLSGHIDSAVAENLTETDYRDLPHTGMRRAIARRLTEAKSSIPHFYVSADCRVDKLLELRSQMNETIGVKISVNDWVIKAVSSALIEVPEANVIWTADSLRYYLRADIAVAVAVEGGLLAPVLRGVESMTLTQINQEVNRLATKAREGKIAQEEIEGGSFSVSNLGMYGTDSFQAILNPPQSGILAVGTARDAVVVDRGEPAVGKVMTVNLSADHRAVDGALAAEWMKTFRHYLENPLLLLA